MSSNQGGTDEKKPEEKKKYIIYPNKLDITWGNDRRYWKLSYKSLDEESYAELKQVCWLEVTGSSEEDVMPGKKYKVSFTVSLTPYAFGWDNCKVYIMAKIGKKGSYTFKTSIIANADFGKFSIPKTEHLIITVPTKKDSDDDLQLRFGLYEVWTGRWKGGLRIHKAVIERLDN